MLHPSTSVIFLHKKWRKYCGGETDFYDNAAMRTTTDVIRLWCFPGVLMLRPQALRSWSRRRFLLAVVAKVLLIMDFKVVFTWPTRTLYASTLPWWHRAPSTNSGHCVATVSCIVFFGSLHVSLPHRSHLPPFLFNPSPPPSPPFESFYVRQHTFLQPS